MVQPSRRISFFNCSSISLPLGKPVVASAVGGLPEMVHDGETGLLVEPGDGAGIADAVERVLSPVFDRAAMVETARAHLEKNFTVAKSTATLLKLLAGNSRKVCREQKESLVYS